MTALVALLPPCLLALLLLRLATVLDPDPDAAVPRVKAAAPLPLRFRHDGAFKILQVSCSLARYAQLRASSSRFPFRRLLIDYARLLADAGRWRTCTSGTAPPRAAGTWRRTAAARAAPTSTPRGSCAGSSRLRGPTSSPSLVRPPFFPPPP